jgi:histidine triad (HIT) family protein
MGCIFCDIVAGDAPAQIVHDDALTLGFMDINPATRGHTLVIPKAHHVDWWDTPERLVGPIATAAHRVARRIKATLEPDGLNLFQATRLAGFQSVFHVHVHVIPRYHDDELAPPWRKAPGDPEAIARTADAIRRG